MKLGPYELDQIYTGDARELAKAIPDESVDLIFTDPPYLRSNLKLYDWLSETARRILVDGGSCITLCGHEHLRDAIYQMDKYLSYHWICCLWQPGQSGLMWNKSIMAKWKPILWFSKGNPTPNVRRFIMDGIIGDGTQGKNFHIWGQPISWAYWIDRLLYNTVFDPFTGGGTVPAVCKMLGRHYLAFEIDPDTAERARQRVDNTQPPLLIPQPEQLELEAMA